MEEWHVFYEALPDGEYKGLGELRTSMIILERELAALAEQREEIEFLKGEFPAGG